MCIYLLIWHNVHISWELYIEVNKINYMLEIEVEVSSNNYNWLVMN